MTRAFSGFLKNFLDRATHGFNPQLLAIGAAIGQLGALDTPLGAKYQVSGAGHSATYGALRKPVVKECPA